MMPIYSNSTKFFNRHQVLLPWPDVLRRDKFKYLYKPREVWWNCWVKKLGLRKDQKVLEVGCGRGIFLDRLAGKYDVAGTGIDIADAAINEAKTESVYRHNFVVGDATTMPFRNNSFDLVISFDVLEHIGNQKRAVSEMARVLKPNGRLMIYTINAKQDFTWNNLLQKLGADIFNEVDHNPKLFVDRKWLKKELLKNDVKVTKAGYFDAFFTLMVDEIIMIFLKYWQKSFGWAKTKRFAKIIMHFLGLFSQVLTPLLVVFDLPWTIGGYSNAFLVVGQKE